jgi:hypothetical protein
VTRAQIYSGPCVSNANEGGARANAAFAERMFSLQMASTSLSTSRGRDWWYRYRLSSSPSSVSSSSICWSCMLTCALTSASYTALAVVLARRQNNCNTGGHLCNVVFRRHFASYLSSGSRISQSRSQSRSRECEREGASSNQGQLYTDLTGRFTVRSIKGNWYVMAVYSFDCNYIKPVAMKSKTEYEWLKAFGGIFCFKPKLQTLYNLASAALKHYFTGNEMTYQLVPPRCHRRNAAEHVIITGKEHFVASLSSVDPYFPFHLWDRLQSQAEMTLNLLYTSR